ncbi:MAG TPA: DUF3471 domain-containing protein, partial [Bryobacteraceae bacterium]|nr:DUF3471 domain-containing protein [Bryobacteraceae bacterium]
RRFKDTRPSRELTAYAGSFQEPAYGTVDVTYRDDSLRLKWSNYESTLEHFHFDTFRMKGTGLLKDELVQFVLDKNGTVRQVRMLDAEFERKEQQR